jgi:aminopeptidase N
VIDALSRAVGADAFWAVQAAAATALGEIRSARALEALAANAGAAHPKTRRAVARALGQFRTERAAAVLTRMSHGEPSWFVTAESLRSMGKTRVPVVFERLVEALAISSYEETVRVGAIDGLGELRDDRAIPIVTARTAPSEYSSIRTASIRALGKLGEGKAAVRDTLERLLDDADFRARQAAIRALAEVGDSRAIPAIERLADRDLEGRIVRASREVVRDLAAGRKWTDELGSLRDSVERMRQEARDLRDRVVTLETRLAQASHTSKEGSK